MTTPVISWSRADGCAILTFGSLRVEVTESRRGGYDVQAFSGGRAAERRWLQTLQEAKDAAEILVLSYLPRARPPVYEESIRIGQRT